MKLSRTAVALAFGIAAGGLAAILGAEPAPTAVPQVLPSLAPLTNVPVPEPPNLGEYVRDRNAAVVLGKAFFWDVQAGSDGSRACASCHFHAGADTRATSEALPPARFRSVTPGRAEETCEPGSAPAGAHHAPRRNAPSVINAAFNFRSFWDGRASNVFNGVNAFGRRDPDAAILEQQASGRVTRVAVALVDASAASQAVTPAMSPLEMSCAGRTFADLGRKLLTLRPLARQEVDSTDGVLGPLVDASGTGLRESYPTLIKRAFQPKYWRAPGRFGGVTQMEANFSLFWGLAIQAYESTLVSGQTPFDAFVLGHHDALTREQKLGLDLFQGKARCMLCHAGPEFSSAGTLARAQHASGALVDRMFTADVKSALSDRGFFNIGVAATTDDLGLGGTDSFGHPLSFTRQAKQKAARHVTPDRFAVDVHTFTMDPARAIDARERDAVDGAFKVPSLRNVELTGPYFHTGSVPTLDAVIEFYDRGGNRNAPGGRDRSGFGPNPTNIAALIEPIFLTTVEKAALRAFLEALTDERVRWEQAPFDHPQLAIGGGVEIPAIGADGRAARGLPSLRGSPRPR